jgi:hypothetical protein
MSKHDTPGAGEEGTDELVNKYLKDTPHMKIVQSPHNKLFSFSELLKMSYVKHTEEKSSINKT